MRRRLLRGRCSAGTRVRGWWCFSVRRRSRCGALAGGRPDIAERLLAPWRQAVGGGLRLAIVCWGLSGTGPGSVRLAAHTPALADRLGIPAVLTNAVRYADRSQHRVADVLDAARLLRPVDRRRLDCGERRLKGGPTMTEIAELVAAAYGGGRARAERLLADTVAVAEACEVDPVRDLGARGAALPSSRPSSARRRVRTGRCDCCGSGARAAWPPAVSTGTGVRWTSSTTNSA